MNNEIEESPWKLFLDWITGRGRRPRDLVKEMEILIEEGTAEGVLNEEQEEMLLSVLAFRKTMVREVVVPRTEMVCVEVSESLDDLVRRMVEEGHSRIPIYEDDVEHIVGFITARDVLAYWGTPPPHPPLSEILRPAFFVPETMSLEVILGEFKRRGLHMALAVDEYGGIAGIVTLEDVLEEIVGEIRDEYDEEQTEITEAVDGLLVDARTEIEKVEEHLGMELGAGGQYATIGGLVFHVLGRIPKTGETFRHNGLEITIQGADKRRIQELKIRRIPTAEPSEDSEGSGVRSGE
jgi:magnesium and cobalt transporter